MRDLTDQRLIHLKALLFLTLGVMAAAGVVAACPSLRVAALLATSIWAFARLYYYAFYVLERYVDPRLRYAGLLALVRAAAARRGPSD